MKSRWTLFAAALIAALAFSLTACGDSKPEVCSSRDNLQKSVDNLKQFDASKGLDGLSDALKQVKTNAQAFADDTKTEFPSQTADFTSSLDELESVVNKAQSKDASKSAQQIGLAVAKFVLATQTLTDAVKGKCD